MKKLYRKGTVHPSPPIVSDQLSFLPAAILTLAAALSADDREVLAYLISADPHRKSAHKPADDHPILFNCSCFSCYMSYWVRWDSSPNRHLIHDIIDAFEDSLAHKKPSSKKDRKKRPANNKSASGSTAPEPKRTDFKAESAGESRLVEESAAVDSGADGQEGLEKGSVRKMVSFIGEKIWGVWG